MILGFNIDKCATCSCVCPVSLHISSLYAATISLNSSIDGRQAACPGEVVTFTCSVIQGVTLEWLAQPFITPVNRVQFTSSSPENAVIDCNDNSSAVQCSDFDYQATLTDVDNVGGGFADMTSTFRFTANAMLNGTVVECSVTILTGSLGSNSTLNMAGEIYIQRCYSFGCVNCEGADHASF